jgi:hypothetical protein
MSERPTDPSLLTGLILLLAVILLFVAATSCQPDFFQNFSAVF